MQAAHKSCILFLHTLHLESKEVAACASMLWLTNLGAPAFFVAQHCFAYTCSGFCAVLMHDHTAQLGIMTCSVPVSVGTAIGVAVCLLSANLRACRVLQLDLVRKENATLYERQKSVSKTPRLDEMSAKSGMQQSSRCERRISGSST